MSWNRSLGTVRTRSAAHHGLHVHIRAGAHAVETVTRHGVTRERGDHGAAVLTLRLDAVPDGRRDRSMIGRRREHPHAIGLPRDAVDDLADAAARLPLEIGVVIQPVPHVVDQHRERSIDEPCGSRRPDDRERRLDRRHHPPRRDHVVEVGGVVAVEVREQQRVEHRRERGGTGQAHADAAPAIDEQGLPRGTHEDRRARRGSDPESVIRSRASRRPSPSSRALPDVDCGSLQAQ